MRAIGAWMKVNRESIFGTTASPVAKPGWGRITAREGKRDTTLYLHVFDWPRSGQLTLEGVPNKIRRAKLLGGGKMTAESRNGIIFITCPPNAPDPVDSVIALTLDGPIARRPDLQTPDLKCNVSLSSPPSVISCAGFAASDSCVPDLGLELGGNVPCGGFAATSAALSGCPGDDPGTARHHERDGRLRLGCAALPHARQHLPKQPRPPR